MNQTTGQILEAKTDEEQAEMERSFKQMLKGEHDGLVPILKEKLEELEDMNRHDRRAWAAQERARLRREALVKEIEEQDEDTERKGRRAIKSPCPAKD